MLKHSRWELSPERGSGSVLSIALALVVSVMIVGLLAMGGSVRAKHALHNAADAAALIAAHDAWQRGEQAGCASAHKSAQANKAEVVSCSLQGNHASVELRTTYRVGVGFFAYEYQLTAAAVAGPVGDPPPKAENRSARDNWQA
ncbi:flp pilus-assembly TadE/G-like family protein [Arcanobacterium haemolyticum]|nr:flp pilus-assembly TadE/G-like family protein [Arcanobacterium haemolyticum]